MTRDEGECGDGGEYWHDREGGKQWRLMGNGREIKRDDERQQGKISCCFIMLLKHANGNPCQLVSIDAC
jgi:hypothetical protein